jgi:hypothetical protein
MRWLFYTPRQTMIATTAEMMMKSHIPETDLVVLKGVENLDRCLPSLQPTLTHALFIVNKTADLDALKKFGASLLKLECLIGWTDYMRKSESWESFQFHPSIILYLPSDFGFLQEIFQNIDSPLCAPFRNSPATTVQRGEKKVHL